MKGKIGIDTKRVITFIGKVLLLLLFIQMLIIINHQVNIGLYVRYLPSNKNLKSPTARSFETDFVRYLSSNDFLENNVKECDKRPWEQANSNFSLPQDKTQYFANVGAGLLCLKEGTNLTTTEQSGGKTCVCKPRWYGKWCSIPHVVHVSNYNFKRFPLTPRLRPKRFVSAFPFNMEFPMLEARFADLGNLVDAFMILESNYTAFGKPKPLYLIDKLKEGYYDLVACNIVHIFLPYFPKEAYDNGWIADNLHRNYIGQHGVVHQLQQAQHDDIFWLSDADEIPSRETVLFLKVHDGYPEPIGIYLQKSTYGFFWTGQQTTVHLIAGVSFGFLGHVFFNKAIEVRSAQSSMLKHSSKLNIYLKTGANVSLWSVGSDNTPAGWHCSWCGTPEFIRNKLVSAQNGDFPRWGDYPEKLDLQYIIHLIREGVWFDDKAKMIKANSSSHMYAPPFILHHKQRYRDLLYKPYLSQNTSSTTVMPKVMSTIKNS